MVSGDFRLGAIASFICDDGRYLLASYFQENLKYVKDDQPVEVALNLYPGQIFKAKVKSIWKANGDGQLLPSGTLPKLAGATGRRINMRSPFFTTTPTSRISHRRARRRRLSRHGRHDWRLGRPAYRDPHLRGLILFTRALLKLAKLRLNQN
jgi:hypothetical protein